MAIKYASDPDNDKYDGESHPKETPAKISTTAESETDPFASETAYQNLPVTEQLSNFLRDMEIRREQSGAKKRTEKDHDDNKGFPSSFLESPLPDTKE